MSSLNNIESIVNKLNIPTDVKIKASMDTDMIINGANGFFSRESLGNSLENYAYSLKIEPLSYVDEKKYYTYIDAAYKIYEQLTTSKENKQSSQFAWCVANSAIYNWYCRSLLGSTLSGIEVMAEVDYAIRAPMQYLLMNCLSGLIKIVTAAITSYFTTNALGIPSVALHLLSFYIISSIINFVKLSIRIRKGSINELEPVRPTA